MNKTEGICYHPYIALIAYLDDSAAIRTPGVSPPSAGSRFRDACIQYRARIEKNRSRFLDRNPALNSSEQEFSPYLFDPLCYKAIGVTDALGFALLDDFESFLRITADPYVSLDQATLAFCPQVESIVDDRGAFPFLLDPHQLYDDPPAGEKQGTPGLENAFQKRLPLALVARFKTDGFTLLDHALLTESTLWKTMAERTRNVLKALQDNLGKPEVRDLGITKTDIDSYRCLFLSTQGSDNIGLIGFCRNYSVAVSVICALRTLCYADLIGINPALGDMGRERQNATHAVIDAGRSLGCVALSSRDGVAGLSGNHILAMTYSTMCVTSNAWDGHATALSGWIEAYGRFDIVPGHFRDTMARLDKIYSVSLGIERANILDKPYMRFLLGRHDFDASIHTGDNTVTSDPIDIARFFEISRETLRGLTRQPDSSPSGAPYEPAIFDSSSWIVLPVPNLKHTDAIFRDMSSEHVPVAYTLHKMMEASFPSPDSPENNESDFDIRRLDRVMRQIGMPPQLRRTIDYLVKNFRTCMFDPLLFHAVLDLIPPFHSLFNAIAEDLLSDFRQERTKYQELGFSPKRHSGVFLRKEAVEGLSDYVAALQNALSHRISFHPNMEYLDWGVDYRGGLNQLVAAADVPFKCAEQLVRAFLPDDDGYGGMPVNSVMRLTFRPWSRVTEARLGGDVRTRLAVTEMSVALIFDPADYFDLLHDAGHLIFNGLFEDQPELRELAGSAPAVAAKRERAHEIFADLVATVFVFDADWKLACKHLTLGFTQHPTSIGGSPEDTLRRTVEFFLRLYMIAGPMGELVTGDDPIDESWIEYPWSCREIDKEREEEFGAFLSSWGPLLSQFDVLWKQPNAQEYAIRRFRRLFSETAEIVSLFWGQVVKTYLQIAKLAVPWRDGGRAQARKDIRDAFRVGMPIDTSGLVSAQSQLAMLCDCLYVYIDHAAGKIDPRKHVHLERDDDGELSYGGDQNSWNYAVFGRGYTKSVCYMPRQRGDRLRYDISFLKTLWGMSGILRAEQFAKLAQLLHRDDAAGVEGMIDG